MLIAGRSDFACFFSVLTESLFLFCQVTKHTFYQLGHCQKCRKQHVLPALTEVLVILMKVLSLCSLKPFQNVFFEIGYMYVYIHISQINFYLGATFCSENEEAEATLKLISGKT